jgi:lipopolysaccharide/colanic/teichoic acid biosynthesis glycosyltransferase/glycosyltransferase involved in cell wall biosynthesis
MSAQVAIVHDWLTSMRGGERVVEALFRVFPQADLFTLTWNPSRLSPALAGRRVTTSAIHRVAAVPLVGHRFRALLPLFPRAVESFNLDRYSLVISSSHCVAIGAVAPASALHVAYVHSTMRYTREAQGAYEASVPGGIAGRALFRGVADHLRRWERAAAARPHLFIANSTYTRERIGRYFDRDALVIEPPIDTARFARAAAAAPPAGDKAPFLMVSALVPNKRVDLALRAFRGRSERLIVVGEGPERERLERLAPPNVTLLPRVGEAEIESLFASSRALIHTGVDDFGMVMVEAMAAGKPVLACAEGGALDMVRDGQTGLLIETPTVEAVRATLDRFEHLPRPFESGALQRFAERFDRAHFERRFAEAVDDAWRRRKASTLNGKANGHGPVRVATAPPSTPATVTPSPTSLAGKRLADVTLAASGLVLTAPLLAALAVLIPIDSPGPSFFLQRRTGLHQRPFTLVKLRTMDRHGRVTRLGRFLRPTGLDELPQLWSVLLGDMSLVGPRPEVPERVERFESDLPGFRARHQIRPGITGWAQVNGLRGNVSIAERLRFDIQYLRERTLAFDGRILVRTVGTVVRDTVRELRG